MKNSKRLMPVHMIFPALILMMFFVVHTAAAADKDLLARWSGAVCKDLGCMSIGTQQMGVNLSALGMVQDNSVLESFGFTFGEGPYRISATRIDNGRYRVSLQAMSRPSDNQRKAILLNTRADSIYPFSVQTAPSGQYTWNSAIQFDMENQMGIVSHFEIEEKPVTFINIRVIDLEKLEAFGVSGYQKDHQSCQILYAGGDNWILNPGEYKLSYKNKRWSSKGGIAPVSQPVPVKPKKNVTAPLSDPALLFENSDFEMGDLTNWTKEGNAFDFQPTKGDNPTARRKRQPSRHQGKFWVGTYEKYQGKANQKPGRSQGDRPTGTLTSVEFEIKADTISFLVGGGRNRDKQRVSLVVDGKVVLSASGSANETMKKQSWDVSAYKGKTAQIIIEDAYTGGWGHINADNFRYENVR